MTDQAIVFKNRRRAATLTRTADGTLFRYDAEYEGPPVASTLPPGATSLTPPGSVPPFFAGLLPEGRRLTALRRAIKASADDELSLLAAIGSDTIGDVQVAANDAAPAEVDVAVAVEIARESGTLDFDELLADGGVHDRVGLPGVQDKVSGRMIAMPARHAGERYILKLDPPEFPRVVANESYFIGVARRCRIPTVDARIISDRNGREGLLVRRFDRIPRATGAPELLAVEDACQALGRWPADKYSMSMRTAVDAVTRLCEASAVAARDAFRQVVFAILTGNGDLHAKNLAVLGDRLGESRVSPAYDLPSTVPYGDTTLALAVEGRKTGVSRRILIDFAASIGLPESAATRVIDTLLAGTAAVDDDLEDGALPFPDAIIGKLRKELAYRRRLLVG